jgi:hypothetical protein
VAQNHVLWEALVLAVLNLQVLVPYGWLVNWMGKDCNLFQNIPQVLKTGCFWVFEKAVEFSVSEINKKAVPNV